MKFIEKRYENGQEHLMIVELDPEVMIQKLGQEFDENEDVAILEELKMADGRLCVTLKDKRRKIILQYKEAKGENV